MAVTLFRHGHDRFCDGHDRFRHGHDRFRSLEAGSRGINGHGHDRFRGGPSRMCWLRSDRELRRKQDSRR